MPELYNYNVTTLADAMNQSIQRIGIIQNNMQNANTIAFKSVHPESVMFASVLEDVFRDERQGVLSQTGQKLDLALTKEGAFFLVEGEDGHPVRTRDGQFGLDQDGTIVDFAGRELVIIDKQIKNPAWQELAKGGDIKIEKTGELKVNGEYLGRIAIDYEAKMPGDKAYMLQGKLEISNVDLTENITKIMQAKRHVDTLQSMISMELGVDKSLIETYGRNV